MDIDTNLKKIIQQKPKTNLYYWRNALLYIVFYWIRLYHFLTGYKYPKGPKTEKEFIDEYTEKQKTLFLKNGNQSEPNKNIAQVFYTKKEYLEMMEEEDNSIEAQWKTRILMESTVRGNILMYYDTYKQGFAYYTDSKNIPYDLLNAVAMKYTVLFECRDFFMDEIVFPDEFVSPLIKIQEQKVEPEKEDEIKKEDEKKRMAIMRKNPAFAKLKMYRSEEPENKETNATEEKKEPEKILVVNKFIYLGKMANFSFIQKPKKTMRELPLSSKKVSYKDYKQHYR